MTLEEFNSWYDRLSSEPVSKLNRDEMGKFLRFSPERFALSKKLDLDKFIKEVNGYKKIIHNKLIVAKRIDELSVYKPDIRPFYFGGVVYDPRICLCIKSYFSDLKHSRFRFYETISYHYIFSEDFIVVFNDKGYNVYISENEFNDHFIDIREVRINEILNKG